MKLKTRSWDEEGAPLAVLIHGVTSSSRTWWRVGPWFADNDWHAVGVDLRGHGQSPRMSGGETLEDLAEDVRETVSELLHAGERIDVLLGHSLGALTALKFCERHGEMVRRVVLEDPPGSAGSRDLEEVARDFESGMARAREAPEAEERALREENPSWAEQDVLYDVAGRRDCGATSVAAFIRSGLRHDLASLIESLESPALLMLAGDEDRSALPEPERTAVRNALRRGTVAELDAGHNVHRDDFEGYVGILGKWLRRLPAGGE